MNVIRKIVFAVSCGLLPLLLFVFGLELSTYKVFSTPDAIKHGLAESGIYDTAVNDVLFQAQNSSSAVDANNGVGLSEISADIPLDKPEIQAAVKQAFPASSLQPEVEQALDDIYAWLNDETAQLNTSIDLGKNKDQLAASLAAHARDKASALPICPTNTPITAGFDVLNATCRPAMLSPDQAATLTRTKLDENEFFKKATFNLTRDHNDQSLLFSNVGISKTAYQRAGTTLWIWGAVTILCIIAAILCSQPRRTGLRRVAKIILGVGLATIILACISVFLSEKAANLLAASSGGIVTFQASIANIIHSLTSDVRSWWLAYGIFLLVLGIIALLTLRIWKEKEIIENTEALPPEKRPHVVIN